MHQHKKTGAGIWRRI